MKKNEVPRGGLRPQSPRSSSARPACEKNSPQPCVCHRTSHRRTDDQRGVHGGVVVDEVNVGALGPDGPFGDPEDDLRTHPQHHPKPGRPPAGPKQRPTTSGERVVTKALDATHSREWSSTMLSTSMKLPSAMATWVTSSDRRGLGPPKDLVAVRGSAYGTPRCAWTSPTAQWRSPTRSTPTASHWVSWAAAARFTLRLRLPTLDKARTRR